MSKIIFSSWAGKVVDNRGLKTEEYVPVEYLTLPLEYDGTKVSAFMGWDGLVVASEKVNVVDMAYAYAREVQKLCCGECAIGWLGISVIVDILARIVGGMGTEADMELLPRLASAMREDAKCVLGQSAPVPILDTLKYYEQEYLELIRNKKAAPKSNYRVKVTAPCIEACPAHIDIPGYIELIRNWRYSESLSLIRERNCLPTISGRVCAAPCENTCTRKDIDGPVAIRALRRYVTEWELGEGLTPSVSKSEETKEKVAIIGAGPAGLAAAYNLALNGYQVTIFEELPVVGGMAAVGIPEYRLPTDVLEREVDIIRKMGVEIKLNTRIGRDLSIEDLWKDGYKAIFVAIGAHQSRKIGAEGEDQSYEGFVDGVKFLRDLNLGRAMESKDRVLVIGGGDVAVDCARSCLRIGFKDVNILYRRSRVEMPARKAEIEEAEREGVRIDYLVTPTKIVAENGKVRGAECIRMKLGEPDASGRRRPIPVEGSEFVIETDVIIAAVGQQPDLSCLTEGDQVKVTDYMTVEADASTCQTSRGGIFCGGDCATGPALLIDALAAGNRAAQSIDQYLREGKVVQSEDAKREKALQGIDVYPQREKVIVGKKAPGYIHHLPLEERTSNFREVEQVFSAEAALEEAKRCLRCYRVMVLATTE